MRDLPLAAEHQRLRAIFGSSGGWRVPIDYGDVMAEQRAVRNSAGVIDWSLRGKVRVTGEDRLAFLDGLLTNDLKPLVEGRGLWAATLDHKAHVQGDMAVYHAGDHYLLETEPDIGPRIIGYLAKLLVSDDVFLEDISAELAIVGVFGPQSRSLVQRALGIAPPVAPYDHLVTIQDGSSLRVIRSPYFGGEGYEVWGPTERAARVWGSVVEEGAIPFGLGASEALRIEAGRPRFGVDMDESTLALEARLEPAISMTKGCYVGQEIVSRAVYQGHLNRWLVGLEVDAPTPPAPGTSVDAQGSRIGYVTSAATSAWRGKVLALAYVHRRRAEPGTQVSVGPFAARVAALPFYPA